jgi:hypothetical protein
MPAFKVLGWNELASLHRKNPWMTWLQQELLVSLRRTCASIGGEQPC